MKTVLITGATSGIGRACAENLAKSGNFKLILCGRRKDRLEQIQKELSSLTAVSILNFDVRDREAITTALNHLPEEFKTIDVLINNAGNAHGLGEIHQGDFDDWDAMIDINIKGVLNLSRIIAPKMVERESGHIINIGSLAGLDTYPQGNVYNASKFAVRALSEAMRIDLHKYNIRVSEVKPGLVETEFSEVRFKGDKAKAKKVYEGFTPLYAEDIAEVIAFVLSRPPHVNIADILVLPSDQAKSKIVNKKK